MIPFHSKFPLRLNFLKFRAIAKQSSTSHARILTSPHVPSRLSIIVPKKVNKQATTRNYLKRLVYDLVWQDISSKNLDCVIIFKPIPLLKEKTTKGILSHELSQIFSLR